MLRKEIDQGSQVNTSTHNLECDNVFYITGQRRGGQKGKRETSMKETNCERTSNDDLKPWLGRRGRDEVSA